MSRATETITGSIVARLPVGFALGARGGVLDAIFEGTSKELRRVEDEAASIMDEIDPRTANRFLPDFERVLGPDACGRDRNAPSFAERQRIAHQRWTAGGGQSIPYLTALAEKLGYEIEIEEFWPSKADELQAGDELISEGEQFVWRVRLVPVDEVIFRAGDSQAGDLLVSYKISDLECELRRIAHAHTEVVFINDLIEE